MAQAKSIRFGFARDAEENRKSLVETSADNRKVYKSLFTHYFSGTDNHPFYDWIGCARNMRNFICMVVAILRWGGRPIRLRRV